MSVPSSPKASMRSVTGRESPTTKRSADSAKGSSNLVAFGAGRHRAGRAIHARDSADQAALFVGRLIEATDRLGSIPLSGRIIPEIGHPDCREIIYGAYRILYRVQGEDVWITGVVH